MPTRAQRSLSGFGRVNAIPRPVRGFHCRSFLSVSLQQPSCCLVASVASVGTWGSHRTDQGQLGIRCGF